MHSYVYPSLFTLHSIKIVSVPWSLINSDDWFDSRPTLIWYVHAWSGAPGLQILAPWNIFRLEDRKIFGHFLKMLYLCLFSHRVGALGASGYSLLIDVPNLSEPDNTASFNAKLISLWRKRTQSWTNNMLWCKSKYKDEEVENESSSDYDHISVKSSWDHSATCISRWQFQSFSARRAYVKCHFFSVTTLLASRTIKLTVFCLSEQINMT